MEKVPERSEIAQKYKWDLESIYSENGEWRNSLESVKKRLDGFELYEGRVCESGDTLLELSKLSAIANMPSREQALSQLAGMLNAPMNQFVSILNQVPSTIVRTLQAVKEKKEQANVEIP